MTTNRENLLGKIKALLNKTTENGCTEEEALSALAKARAMMDAYEVTESDLQLTKAEKAILRKEPPDSLDPHAIKRSLALYIASFCDCRVWRGSNGLVYCGLRPDAEFASFLTDHLQGFVQAELARHLMTCLAPKGQRRLIINGFVGGCAKRIGERMEALVEHSEQVASSNGRALIVVKSQAVAERMKELGIHLHRSTSRRRMDGGAYQAGRAAGERASFGRPVTGTGAVLRLA